MTKSIHPELKPHERRGPIPAKLDKHSDRYNKHALAKVESAIPRERIQQAMAQCDDPRAIKLAWFLGNKNYANYSLFTLAKKRCNLTANECMTLFKQTRAIETTLILMDKMPEIMGDMVEDARSRTRVCPVCEGATEVERGIGENLRKLPCPECDATGRVRVIGDKETRKSLLEAAGFTGKALIDARSQTNIITGQETLEETLAKVTQQPRLSAGPKVIDAEEVVE